MKNVTETARSGSVTCVVVAFNHAQYVEQCLDSAFTQTYSDLRVIVFDDASTDDSQQVIRDYLERTGHAGVTFIAHSKNRGLCATLNEALDLVDTEFVAFISADDWMEPERFAVQVDALNEYGSSYGMLCNNMYVSDASGKIDDETYFEMYECSDLVDGGLSRVQMIKRQVRQWFLPAPAFFYRRDALVDIGGFDDQLRGEDLDITLRLLHRYDVAYSKIPVVYRRVLDSSLGTIKQLDPARNGIEHITVFRKHYGIDQALDATLAQEIAARSKMIYLAGLSYPGLLRDLCRDFRRRPTTATAVYILAISAHVPGGIMALLAKRVRRQHQVARMALV